MQENLNVCFKLRTLHEHKQVFSSTSGISPVGPLSSFILCFQSQLASVRFVNTELNLYELKTIDETCESNNFGIKMRDLVTESLSSGTIKQEKNRVLLPRTQK